MQSCNLRPHHGLCICYFVGKGYDTAFTANMIQTVAALESNNPTVTVAQGMDDLCACCPNNQNGICTSEEKVQWYDNAVLAACGLHYGDTLPWSAFHSLVHQNIIRCGRQSTICGDCEWKCHNFTLVR